MKKLLIITFSMFSMLTFSQIETTEAFYEVSVIPFSVESTEVQPRELTTDEITYISQLRQEDEIVTIDLDLYTRVKVYPKNIQIKLEEK